MRNLILFMIVLFIGTMQIEAQNMRPNDTFFEKTVNVTVSDGDSIYASDVIFVDKQYPYVYDGYVRIDSLNVETDDTVFVKLQGKMFSADSWTDIQTVNNLLATENTTSTFSKLDGLTRYRYLRFYASSKDADSNWKVISYAIKLHKATYTKVAE